MAARKKKATHFTNRDKVAEEWHLIAVVMGYNELTKHMKSLAEKMWARIGRDHFEQELVKLRGAKLYSEEGQRVLESHTAPPFIKFTDADIEAMRKVVADWDAARVPTTCAFCSKPWAFKTDDNVPLCSSVQCSNKYRVS